MGLRLGLVAWQQGDEKLGLGRQPLLEGKRCGRLDRVDAGLRRLEAALALGKRAALGLEEVRLGYLELVAQVADTAQRPMVAQYALGKGDGARAHAAAGDVVDKPRLPRLAGA